MKADSERFERLTFKVVFNEAEATALLLRITCFTIFTNDLSGIYTEYLVLSRPKGYPAILYDLIISNPNEDSKSQHYFLDKINWVTAEELRGDIKTLEVVENRFHYLESVCNARQVPDIMLDCERLRQFLSYMRQYV